jgi:hypothetical protein
MTPKEKAQELVDKFYNLQSSIAWTTNDELKRQASIFNDELGEDVEIYWDKLAKQTAVIAVDEILKSKKLEYLFTKEQISCMEYTSDDGWINEKFTKYWKKVKQEIINLLNNK